MHRRDRSAHGPRRAAVESPRVDGAGLETDRSEGDVNLSPLRARWQAEQLDAATRALLEEDERYFLHQALSTPCLNALESCKGSALVDLEGRSLLDFHGNSAHQIGYGHPKVLRAIREQLETLPFCPRRYTNLAAVGLARRLTTLAPMTEARALFAPGGASAISMALKLARLTTRRHKMISWRGSFHGATIDAISIGGEAMFREGLGPLLPGAFHAAPPGGPDGVSVEESLRQIEQIFLREVEIAAFVAETIRCTTVVQPSAEYWQQIRALCDRFGALLILDEIPIGLGRTGHLFACEYTGIRPDILCLGKGLGGGIFPMAAMLACGRLNTVASSSIGHFTHEKSPVGAAASLATLDVIEEEGLLERARSFGAEVLEKLQDLRARHSGIVEVRGCGMLFAVELESAQRAEALLYACLRRGLSFKVSSGTVLTLAPPLNISAEDMERALSVLEASFAEVRA